MTRHALRAANEAFYAAFQSLDLERMESLWAREGLVSCVHPGWDLVSGREAVIQSFRTIFEGTTSIRFRIEDAHITAGTEVGFVVCRELLSTEVQGVTVENVLTTTNAFVREQGEWRITHRHAAPLLAGKPRTVRPPPTLLH
jgi:ketosteroid isomerase-like protein